MKRETLKHLEAYNAIKQLIAGQKLIPGQKLTLRDLEETLGMSKTPIINSLMMLEQEGLVTSKQNRGFYMKAVTAEEAEQIYDLREKLEAISVEYAVANHDKSDLKDLKKSLDIYKKYTEPIYDRVRLKLDTDFHMQIATMGKNSYFTAMLKQFYENIYFSLNMVYLTPYIENFTTEHDLIYEAIKNRDVKKGKELLKKHFRAARKLQTAALQKNLRSDI